MNLKTLKLLLIYLDMLCPVAKIGSSNLNILIPLR